MRRSVWVEKVPESVVRGFGHFGARRKKKSGQARGGVRFYEGRAARAMYCLGVSACRPRMTALTSSTPATARLRS